MVKRHELIPTTNWRMQTVVDGIQIEDARCDLCNRRLRWIHALEHDDEPYAIGVGGCCATRLCNDYDANEAERECRSRERRRKQFTNTAKWKRSKGKPGNIWRFAKSEFGEWRATVFIKFDKYQAVIALPKDDLRFVPGSYAKQSQALNATFDLFESIVAELTEAAAIEAESNAYYDDEHVDDSDASELDDEANFEGDFEV